MSDTREQILQRIDQASESIPRPPLWLRALVASALALPFLVGVLYGGLSTREQPELAKNEAGSLAMARLGSGLSSSSSGVAKIPDAASRPEPKPPVTRVKLPKASGTVASPDILADLFGVKEDPAPPPATTTPTKQEDPIVGASGDAPAAIPGLDIGGWPGEDVTPPATAPVADVDPTPSPDAATTEPSTTASADPVEPPPEREKPDITDLSALMSQTTQEVTDDLQERYPVVVPGAAVALKYTTGSSVNGQVLFLGNGLVMLNVNNERLPVYVNQLDPSSRIRCDRDFRQAQILREVEKRMLEAIK